MLIKYLKNINKNADLIRYLEESVGCRVILVGIEPKQMEEGQPVSAAVKRSAEALAESLLRIWIKEPRC